MPKYLFAYHSGPTPEAISPELMEKWTTWFGQMGEAIVDGGAPVGQSSTVSNAGTSEGGGANPVSGYTIVSADSLDAACQMAKGCPSLASGGSVEVAECMEM